jgi:SAM-dependent MidA family methyltransferase
MPSLEPATHNATLCRLIAQRINQQPQQQITFADYMNWVLYEPEQGYYAANAVQIGAQGDFFTAPHLGSDFGELIAEQCCQMWQHLNSPDSFTLVEMGAGQGLIAMDVLRHLQHRAATDPIYAGFWAALQYIIVEKAAALIAEQKHHLQAFQDKPHKLQWLTLTEIPQNSITGCLFSNELVDALPVHQIMIQGGELLEVYVQAKEIAISDIDPKNPIFQEQYGQPSTPKLSAYLDWMEIDYRQLPEGYRSEINLAALKWLGEAAGKLKQGYLLTIDYGYSADQYYSPARQQGTLQCYRHHACHNNPYLYVGRQDITSHVNFTALEHHGKTLGLENLGRTQQGLFLMALGLGDRLVTNNNTADLTQLSKVLRRREAIHCLINPMGLGGFQVLAQGRGLSSQQRTSTLAGMKM